VRLPCLLPPRLRGTERGVVRRLSEAAAGCSDDTRFQLELEFVQCLANPRYINCAAQQPRFCRGRP